MSATVFIKLEWVKLNWTRLNFYVHWKHFNFNFEIIYKIWTFVSLKRQQLIQGGLINKNKWLDAENYVTNNE